MNQLIDRLKLYKDDNDLTYRQLSSLTNLNHVWLYRVMTGKRNLTLDFCRAVSGFLELELTEALELGGLLTNSNKQGDQAEAQSPCVGEHHNGKYTQETSK